MDTYVGIDVAKASLQVCVLTTPAQQQRFDNAKKGWTALKRWLKAWEGVWVGLEATGTYGDGVTLALYQAGYRVSVINPARIKAYGIGHKLSNRKKSQGGFSRDFADKIGSRSIKRSPPSRKTYHWWARHLSNTARRWHFPADCTLFSP